MKRRNVSQIMAFLMAVIMTLSLVPSLAVFATDASKANDTTILTLNVSDIPEGDITTEQVVGDFVLHANSDKKLTVDGNEKTNEDGSIKFTKRLKMNGKSGESERTITFATTGAGTAKVYMLSSNKDEATRALSLHYDESGDMIEGASYYAPVAAGDNGELTAFEYPIPEAGTYRFMASQAINIYYIEVEYSGSAATGVSRKAWNEVADPKINSVKINDAGTIDVDVTVDIGVDGADSARLLLMQNGYEAISTQVTESGVYTFAPTLKGNFDVKLIMLRKGSEDKVSNIEKVSDYKLPMVAPTIQWVNNLGNGEVYVDWMNTRADSYEVQVRGAGENGFRTVASGITEGNYTITGLTSGQNIDVKVIATDAGRTAEDTKVNFTVGDPEQQWYIASIGSATKGTARISDNAVAIESAKGAIEVNSIAGRTGTLEIDAATNGKIADSEDGVFYYYTIIDPNTENFKLTATFTVINTDEGPDNQTGYGIYAMDVAGLGSKDAKYFNSVSVGQFKLANGSYHGNGARFVTGYTSYDAYNLDGAVRDHNNKNAFSVENDNDDVVVGDKLTFSLEKTDYGFVASMDGAKDTIFLEGADSLMVQDNGLMYVGVAVARKVGVEISNLKFEKYEGSVGGSSVKLVEPELKVYSSDITATTNYEAIASATVEGKLVITGAGKEIYSGNVKANEVVKANVAVAEQGSAEVSYTFTPSKSIENLTSYDEIKTSKTVVYGMINTNNGVVYVSPNGSSAGDGSKSSPYDLQTVLDNVAPGTTVVLMDGTYAPSEGYKVARSINGTSEAPITLVPEHDGAVILDGSNITDKKAVFDLVGSYFTIYGLKVINGPSRGIMVSGNNNTIEMCEFYGNGTAGVQISRHSDEPNDNLMWPSNNLVKNCDSHDNCDAGRTDADGFAAKLTCGEGNKFFGCIAHNNIDDGFDLYAKSTTGSIGVVVIENCIAYSNGFLSNEDPKNPSTSFGEGNGFKLGGENMLGAHQLINSIAFNNYAKGISSNSGPNCEVINCTVYNNSLKGNTNNIALYTKSTNPKAWILNGLVSYVDSELCQMELGSDIGIIYSLRSENNFIYDGMESSNSKGKTVEADWFESLDITVLPTRNADGTIDMHDLLVLTKVAPETAGARIDTTTRDAISVKPTYAGAVSSSSSVAEIGSEVEVSSGTMPLWLTIILIVVAVIVVSLVVVWYKIHY